MTNFVEDGAFCCDAMRSVVGELQAPAAPTIYRIDGAMMIVIGLVEAEEGLGYLEQTIQYCPFCGTHLEDNEAVAERVSH